MGGRNGGRHETPYDRARLAKVIEVAAEAYGLAVREMLERSRVQPLPEARQFAMYLARAHTTASYPTIARALALDNHTTAIHGHDLMSRRLENSDEVHLRRRLDLAMALLAGSSGVKERIALEEADAAAYRRTVRETVERSQRRKRRAVSAALRRAG